MELVQKQIRYMKEGRRTFDQFYLDEDINVPDAKEDIRQIIKGDGKIKIEDIRLTENYLRISGKLQYQILYITDAIEACPAVLEGKIPFEEMVYMDEKEMDNWFVQNVRIEFQASMVHSRKVSIRAMVELEIGKEIQSNEATTIDIEETVPVYKKKRNVNLLGLKICKKDIFRIKEEITLPGTKESIGQILLHDIGSRKLEIRTGQGELKLQGELQVFCMYLSEDGKTDWIEQGVTYEGSLPCEGVEEGMFYHVQNSLEDTLLDIRLDEDGEMRVLGVEGTLNLKMNIYEEEQMELLEDIYSLEQRCEFETRESTYEELLVQNHSKCKIMERLSLPELKDDVLQICHGEASIQMEHMESVENGISIEGILHISFLYLRADDAVPFGSWQGMVPFSWILECSDITEDARYNLSWHVEQLSVSLAGSEAVEIKAVLAFNTFIRKPVFMQVITNVDMRENTAEELNKRPGIVGYVVKEGDDLWTLAKRHLTTMEEIMRVNELDSDQVKTGDVLLILKPNMGILGV
ncbi:MAG: DUF3794 domain-containing protein [Ruminococcus sp.]|nr:DUF3794 domain-containing protein [Ruminococcus sp.]